ncbi:hypothetical protein MTO96_026001 [Rhipicephalus appendiculatus]
MRLSAVTATRLVALILCVGKATSKCGQVCTSCVPCESSCGPDEEATPAGIRQQDDFCKPKLTSPSELNKLRTCLCKRGYVRNAWGKCIRREDCYTCRHKANMDFSYCSSSCPETCGVLEQKNCSILCVRGCACAPGYSRLSPGGPCVRPDQCPIGPPAPAPTCPGPHQIYTACPSPCPITCANLNNPPRACPAICGDRHCVCVPGYLAAQENPLKCVPIDECPGREPRRCRGHHQRYTTCKPRCPATCAINGTRICLAGCAGEGCVCRPGYVILRENPLTCVRRQDCPAKPKVCTGPGQRFTTCKSRCPPTCWDNGPQVCTADCAGQGCECMQGFVQLQAKPLVCVRRDKCPAPPQQCLGPVVVPEAPPEVTKVPVQSSKPTVTPPSVPSAPAYPSTPVTPAQPSYPSGYPVTNMIPGAPVYPGVAMYPGASVISPAGVPMIPGGPVENEPAVKTLFNKAHY